MGIDGVRYFSSTLYYTNVSRNSFHKVALDAAGKTVDDIGPASCRKSRQTAKLPIWRRFQVLLLARWGGWRRIGIRCNVMV
ncbi:hypothetical protein M011DRAFT_325968 [Sporormia fimetaria CBS 119925]|uniref:Uncharacterized protein n=1 Tax=Sporormia fimetaria CBS 119925 TaxID=1340428 RepID=A0A6A6VIS7_9PLEO|nr:hypothetical protein M011DRAFT_325968 [Sporormia fimetaria CBS 119925]